MQDEDVLRLGTQRFEASEEASRTAREKSERDIDYYDGKQLTDAEVNALNDRGQPPIVMNLCKGKIDFLVGMEARQRSDPKAVARTPTDDDSAEVATASLRYVSDKNQYHQTRSRVWKDVLVAGWGGGQVTMTQPKRPDRISQALGMETNPDVAIRRTPWDRMFWDPYCAEPDFEDARYRGLAIWSDHSDALFKYRDNPDAKGILDFAMESGRDGGTYDDRPRRVWVDPKRKRLRIIQMWWKDSDRVYWAEMTKGGILAGGESPYVTDDDEHCDPFVWTSAYVDRDNNRYGVLRDLIDPQDEVNKRRSKSLHLLTMNQVIAEENAVQDVAKAKREMAKPDGWITKAPGLELSVVKNTDLSQGQFQLMRDAIERFSQMGPNEALQGLGAATSGRDRQAQQTGGMVQIGGLLDGLRAFDRGVFRKSWSHIKKYWTGPQFIRVTDDENAPKYLGLNEPMIGPGNQVVGSRLNVAEMDMDIVIEEAPDVASIEQEVWQDLSQLVPTLANMPPKWAKLVIEASPLPASRKRRLLSLLEEGQQQQPDPMAEAVAQLEMRGRSAEVADKEASAQLKMAQAQGAMRTAQNGVDPLTQVRADTERMKQRGMAIDQQRAQVQGAMSLEQEQARTEALRLKNAQTLQALMVGMQTEPPPAY